MKTKTLLNELKKITPLLKKVSEETHDESGCVDGLVSYYSRTNILKAEKILHNLIDALKWETEEYTEPQEDRVRTTRFDRLLLGGIAKCKVIKIPIGFTIGVGTFKKGDNPLIVLGEDEYHEHVQVDISLIKNYRHEGKPYSTQKICKLVIDDFVPEIQKSIDIISKESMKYPHK